MEHFHLHYTGHYMNSHAALHVVPSESQLLDQLTTAVIRLDAALCIAYMNQAAESLFSTSLRKVRGTPITDISGVPATLLALLDKARQENQAYLDRQSILHYPGQEPKLLDTLITPFRIDDKTTELLLECTAVDRASRIAREAELRDQQQQYSSMLRGLAHEIKNPLGGLRGSAQLLEQELPDPALKEYTAIIIREADRLQQLLDRMLGPRSAANLTNLNLHEPLEHVRAILQAEAPPGVKLLTDYDPSIPELRSDWNRLTQVFLNIAANALHAIGDNGNITLQSRVTSNFTIGTQCHRLVAVVRIMDDGPGIPADMLGRIFYPMVSSREGGTGLGLSIAQQIIHQLGGLIECSSEPGNTIFTVHLPLEAP